MDQKSTHAKSILPTPGANFSRGVTRKTLSPEEINEN